MLESKDIRDFKQRQYDFEQFEKILDEFKNSKYEVFIGTDSQVIKKRISIVTCMCFTKIQDTGHRSTRIFYIKDKLDQKKYPNLRMRMLLEAYTSIEVAMEIEKYMKERLTIHLDVGTTAKSKTSAYHKELEYLVESQGYKCEVKPDAWASSSIADRMTKS